MLVYFFIFGGICFLGLIDILFPIKKRQADFIFWGWIFICICFKGLRWDTGTDWAQYYACFENASWSNIFSYARYGVGTTIMEPGYVLLNVLIKTIFPHYTFFLLITNAFILIIFGKTINEYLSRYKIATLAIAVVSIELFPVRQTITFALLCYAFRYVVKKDLVKYVISVVICVLFHRSSIIYLLFYPILRSKFKIWRNIFIYILLIFSSEYMDVFFDILHNNAFINRITGGIMDTYDMTSQTMILKDEDSESRNHILTYVSSIVQLVIFYYAYVYAKKKNILDTSFFQIAINGYFIMICLYVIGMIPGFGSLYRITNSLMIFYSLLVGLVVSVFSQRNMRIIAVFIYIVAFVIKFNTLVIMRPQSEEYKLFVPYKTVFQVGEKERSGKW